MSYQETTGTLNANQHGSYTTQDAFGDLLVTDVLHRQRTSESKYIGHSGCAELYARSASRDFEGGYESSLENHGNNNSKTKGGENMKEVSNYVVRRLTPL